MTKSNKTFLVLRRIHSDILNRTHLPGEIVDLNGWPEKIVKLWEARGVIQRLPDVKIFDTEVTRGPER
jgi:hypothetical protein